MGINTPEVISFLDRLWAACPSIPAVALTRTQYSEYQNYAAQCLAFHYRLDTVKACSYRGIKIKVYGEDT
jgi:hypothetical protein